VPRVCPECVRMVPGVYSECARSVPSVRQECARSVPGVRLERKLHDLYTSYANCVTTPAYDTPPHLGADTYIRHKTY